MNNKRRLTEDVARHYDEYHHHYMHYYGDTIQAHRTVTCDELHNYILRSAGIRDGMHILDAGCGVCGPAVYFATHKNIVIDAVNISPRQLEEAQKKIEALSLQNKIRLYLHDFHQLEKLFAPGTFDMILFLESYGHAADKKKVLVSAAQVLKPGGKLYIKDYFRKKISGTAEKKRLMKLGLKNMNRIYCYQTADLKKTLTVLYRLKFQLLSIRKPEFVWDETQTVNAFEAAAGIDLFEGNDRPQIVEPYELKFRKPL